ncbi:hypothetical protein DYB25_013119 [Aphanomyces astaci]|uniref:Uncharacterized protein n=1 Tax=Aphanomyces astaci TaxID=112090 RepID=A0A397AHB2_APHAT|nr:hypothetical protein DYB25_013119 [Aphanomyces astaci]RHY35779.1 hypothetical protein DYB34_008284 [Aphanomyces astaci]
MGLRLHPATETDIGAMLIFSYFASPVKVLTIPPCRYQVEAIGDLNVRSLPYNEIKSRMQALVTYPVVHIITFVRHPMWFTLRFPRRPLHIQIQERIPIGRLEIVDYVQPYTTTDLIPSRFWGTPFIRSVNGLDLAQSTDNAGVRYTLSHIPASHVT